jgi:hypothetical protein
VGGASVCFGGAPRGGKWNVRTTAQAEVEGNVQEGVSGHDDLRGL